MGFFNFTRTQTTLLSILAVASIGTAALVPLAQAQDDPGDWFSQLDDRPGPGTLLPHLGMLRRASTAVLASGVLALERGDRSRAARALSAAIRMGGHARESGFLIGSFCAMSMFQLGEKVITGVLDTGALDADGRAMLRAALERYPDDDPFGVRLGLDQERRVFVGWLRAMGHEYRAGDVRRRDEIRAEIASLIGDEQPDPKIRSLPDDFARAAEGDGVEPILKLLDGAYARALAAWDRADGYEQLERQAREIDAGVMGPIAKAFFPNLTAIHKRDREQRAVLARLRERIAEGMTCVAVFPDRGERYLDTIYSDAWVREHFGDAATRREEDRHPVHAGWSERALAGTPDARVDA